MKTENLIRALASDSIVDPGGARGVTMWLPVTILAGVMALWAVLGFRADLALAMTDPISVMRFVLSGGLGFCGLAMARAMSRPGASLSLWPWLVAGVVLLALGLWVWFFLGTPAEALSMAIRGKTMVVCLVTIPLLSILPLLALILAMRRDAPTNPVLAGAVAGLTGGGFAASIYALHCTEDNPLFYVTWYGLGISIVTLVGAFVGHRVLRW